MKGMDDASYDRCGWGVPMREGVHQCCSAETSSTLRLRRQERRVEGTVWSVRSSVVSSNCCTLRAANSGRPDRGVLENVTKGRVLTFEYTSCLTAQT